MSESWCWLPAGPQSVPRELCEVPRLLSMGALPAGAGCCPEIEKRFPHHKPYRRLCSNQPTLAMEIKPWGKMGGTDPTAHQEVSP